MNFFCFITLILCLFKVSKATESKFFDISRDFKTLLMYFSEAFLKGAVFDGRPLEGDNPIIVAANFVNAIESVKNEYVETPYLEDLVLFQTQLTVGIPIARSILTSHADGHYFALKNEALAVQEKFISALDEHGGVIMPIGWVDHALYLVMRKGEVLADGKYTLDFAVVNTGQGIQYHYHSADPNGVFPRLTQIWVEFKNVQTEEIFTEQAWFFYGLISLNTEFFNSSLKKLFTQQNGNQYPDYFPEYFYGTFLANFNAFLAPHREDRLFPMQRSGSCALSSLVGALLYTSRTEETFYFHRLKIGHALIKSFLAKAQVNEGFKNIIKDGFETNGRNFLKVVASSLAQKTLEYLEFALPDHFKHAGLIGSERFKWIFEKKEAANEALMEATNFVVLETIKTSMELINEIMTFLNDNPISTASNDIVLTEEIKNKFYPLVISFNNYDGVPNHSTSVASFLHGICDRLEEPLMFFCQFYEAFMEYKKIFNADAQLFYRILNVFQRAHHMFIDDNWLQDATHQQLLDLQETCISIASSFLSFCRLKFMSFDDIVLLTYLQKLAWKLAVAYDNRLAEDERIGLGHLTPPRTIQSVLFGFPPINRSGIEVNVLAGNLKQFLIHNCFDQRNVERFMDLMNCDAAELGKENFMGPESFCPVYESTFEAIKPTGRNGELYERMMRNPLVGEVLDALKDKEKGWDTIDSARAEFFIVFFNGRTKLLKDFRHYYNLMDILALVRAGSIRNIGYIKDTTWIDGKNPGIFHQKFSGNTDKITIFKNSYLEIIKKDVIQFHEFDIRNNYRKFENCFYHSRHSLALTKNADITSLETWFNYIKSSSSAKLFDSTYFQYVTDHLLNVPKFGRYGEIIMFPVDKITARSVIEELSRFIGISLETIKTENYRILSGKRRILIIRSVNVSVILTRFISRIDSLNILNGSECATSLSHIYNLMIPFSSFKTDYFLEELEISRINFALGHICTVPIRNALTFMNNVHLATTQKGLRRTLKRYHWFAAKRGYIMSGVGTSVADDQFNYGISASPMTPEETGLLKELLVAYFLPGLINEPSKLIPTDFMFIYSFDFHLVKMKNPAKALEIIINLWTGATVFNGMCLASSNVFINSEQFQSFFAPEDRPLVSNGIAAYVAGISVYAVPDFKGTSYLISREMKYSPFSFPEIKIYRKLDGNWYELTTIKDINNSFKGLNLEYDWIQNNSWIFKRAFGPKSREVIIIRKNELYPVMRFIVDTTSTMKVEVDGFSEESEWTVLSHAEQMIQSKSSSSSRNYLFPRHIESFTRGNYVLAKDGLDQIVVICMNLRFPEDMRRPIVFRENSKMFEGTMATSFKVLNLPKTEIFPNQSLGGSSSLPGGLVIISNSKKAFILPNTSKLEDKTIIKVEKIPISDDNPAPQANEHKLLLAYYLILQFEFNSARKLLNPSSSIHHYEAFSAKEINILKWITDIDLEAPEALALKLFAYMHFAVNRKKFTFDYERNSLPIVSNTFMKTLEYNFSVREMSEKYYIFLVFPEVLKEPLFSILFGGNFNRFLSPPNPVFDKRNISINISNNITADPIPYNIGSRLGGTFLNLILGKQDDQLKLVSRLNLRRNHEQAFIVDTEMAAICYVNEPTMWKEFESILLSLNETSDVNKLKNIYSEVYSKYTKIMNNCILKYGKLFIGINQSSEITMTSPRTLKATFEAEASRIRLNVGNQYANIEPLPELVSQIDIDTISIAEMKLRNHMKLRIEQLFSFSFNTDAMNSSSVLKKLQASIDDFVEEKSESSQSEINLIDTLEDLKVFFSDRLADISIAQELSSAELTTSTTADFCSFTIGSILSLMHQRKAKTFESLYACYLRDSLVCIQKKFPQLNLEQCTEVKEKAKEFYGRQVLINYYGMLKERIESFLEFADEPISADDLNIFCDELSKIKDFNERMKDPVIMNFEFRSQKYRLKPEQVKDVELLTAADQSTHLFPSVVIQRMMAAGKTLVLGTISVVKKALDSNQLSILVPPSSLYQSNTTAMQARTHHYFKKNGINFTFPRFEMPSKENPESMKILTSYLETIYGIITSTMNDNNYMILSPDTLHSFMNSYIEALLGAENNASEEYENIISLYAQIYRIFKQHGSIILDEIDMTMDPKKELNFPTQETEPYNITAVVMLTDIMEFMIFDEKIIEAGLHIHSNNQASLTATGYRNCIQFALNYIESQLENTSSLWYYLVYGSNVHVESVENIMSFLADPCMAGGKEWITTFHESGNQVLADALIIVKHQLHHQMEHALKGTVNLNFGSARGLRPEIKFAVPYAAANTPSTSSVFADRWETLLKTLLMVSASPCSLEIAREFIEYARNAIASESSMSESLQTTATYRNMQLILPTDACPMSLDSKNILHIETVQQALSKRSPAAIRLLFTFYITQVFDKMSFYTEQITSNALNVTSMFNSIQGYSGTIDNVNILPQHVVKEAYEDNLKNEKNNGGIALKLVRDCDDGFVEELNEEAFTKSAEDMVKDLMYLYPSESVSAIIDTGAFFKNFKNIEVARAILSSSETFKAVLYYDEDSNQLQFIRSSSNLESPRILESSDPDYIRTVTEVEIEERFTFYDQRHITGSDILQPKTAHALMTVGPRVLLRDILQGTLRMRQFMTSQKVHLVTTKASRKFYENKIKKVEEDEDIESKADHKIEEVTLKDDKIVEEPAKTKELVERQKLAEVNGANKVAEVAVGERDELETTAIEIEGARMKVSDVLILGALNEDDKQEHENVKLAFGKINAEIRSFVMEEISRALVEVSTDRTREYIFDMVTCGKPLFLRSIKEVPLDWLHESKYENTTHVLKLFALSQLHSLTKVINNYSSNTKLQKRFNSMKQRIKYMISPANEKYFYAKKSICTSIKLDEGTEVQHQILNLTMVDLNMDVLTEISEGRVECKHNYDLISYLKMNVGDETLNVNEALNFEGTPKSSLDFYISLKDLYNGKCSNESLKPYLDDTLITLGDRVGVTQDLINIATTSSWRNFDKGYPIFSKFTFEGTHFLFQLFRFNLKVLLISSNHASNVLKELDPSIPQDFNSSKFWLCDLSGSVTATNDLETERGQNVLDFIPKIDNLMFDLLIFNGSLSHILGNPKLKAIYNNWLRSKNFEKRAIFLRLRMKVLMEKDKEMFENDDENLGLLKNCSLGIQDDTENVVDGYPKLAIEKNYETEKLELLNINSRIQQEIGIAQASSIFFDFNSEVRKIISFYENQLPSVRDIYINEQKDIIAYDVDLDESEIGTGNPESFISIRTKIVIANIPMAEEKSNEVVKKEQLNEFLEHDFEFDEFMVENQNPNITKIELNEINDLSVNFDINTESIKDSASTGPIYPITSEDNEN